MDTIYLGYVNFNSFVCRPERDFDKGTISHNTGNIFSSVNTEKLYILVHNSEICP